MKGQINSISAIWNTLDRKSLKQCSEDVYNFLLLLKNQNKDLFGKWHEKSRSKKVALEKAIKIDKDYFYQALEKKKDANFEDLGMRISYWTGGNDENQSSEIMFNLGAYGSQSFNKNSCVLTLPLENDYYKYKENKQKLINLMLDYWKPDKILINGESYDPANIISDNY